MLFKDIVGHSHVKERLAAAVDVEKVSHAQLFTSAEGGGALPLAMAYAGYLMCRNRVAGDACGVCSECYRSSRMEHPDIHYIFPVNNSKLASAVGRVSDKPVSDQFVARWRELMLRSGGYFTEQQWYEYIGIDNAQGNINKSEANELLRKMSFKSFEGGYKVVIIWLPERMHEAAANTLLKLVEEPPEKTLFLFVSEEPDKIIATIRSRTQLVSLAALDDLTISSRLATEFSLSESEAVRVAHSAQGSWGRAVALVSTDAVNSTEHFELFVELMRLCYMSKFIDLFDWAERISAIGREPQKLFCENSMELLRECYMLSVGVAEVTYIEPSQETFCRKFSPYVNHASIEPLIAEFELLLRQLRQNGNAKILFTHFSLTICKIINNAKGHIVIGK